MEKYIRPTRIVRHSEKLPLTCERCGFLVMTTFAVGDSNQELCFDCMDELARLPKDWAVKF